MKFKVSILNFLMLAALSFVPLHIAYSQTASILPPAKTTYLDKNGKPLAFGTVDFYIPGTTTPKMTWKDAGQTIPNTNPVVLDDAGRSIVLGDGSYRQIVRDKNGNLIWDQITSSSGSGGGGGGTPTVGDGDPVGMIKAWSGFVAPTQYAFAYGQEFVRASYPELLSAITSQQNVSCTTGSATLTGVSDTSQLPIGAPIESPCLNTGATVISKTTNTVVASSVAIITDTSTARFFPYGNGDGSSTFNLPDLRGRIIAGRDNMGGISSNRLTSTYFGSNPNAIGASGGNESQTLTIAQMPAHTHPNTLTDPGHSHLFGPPNLPDFGGTSTTEVWQGNGNGARYSTTTSTTGITINNASQGGGNPHTIVQPTQTYNYIIKILPDSNPNTFFGVASIGGMYGIITCGDGLNCSGNNISVTPGGYTLPPATSGALGGVYSLTCSTSSWFSSLDNTGVFGCSQPNFTDLLGYIAATQIQNNSITNSKLDTAPAATIKGNPTNSTANIQDFTIASLGNIVSPDGNLDYVLAYDHTTNTLKYLTPNQIASTGVAGVASIGGATGIILNGDGLQISSQTAYVSYPVSIINTSTSITTANTVLLCDATFGNITITLPNASSVFNGESITIKRKDNSSNSCSIVVSGGANIDNISSLGVEPQYTSFTLTSDGISQWWIQ